MPSNVTTPFAPCAAHVPATTSLTRRVMVSYTSAERSRIVPPSETESGVTFSTSPPWTIVIERIACSLQCTLRGMIVCSAVMTCAATSTGSTPTCGCDACPPLPSMTILNMAGCAISGPGLTASVPSGYVGQLW